MYNILCMITVTVMVPKFPLVQYRMETQNVLGREISCDEEACFVDFSQQAKEKGYYGDLSRVKVQRIMCQPYVGTM